MTGHLVSVSPLKTKKLSLVWRHFAVSVLAWLVSAVR